METARLLKDEHLRLFTEIDLRRNKNVDLDALKSNSTRKIWWLCPKKAHQWVCSVKERVRSGINCPHCINDDPNNIFNKSFFLANEFHPTLNEGESVENILISSTKKYWWMCSYNCDHIWKDSPKKRFEDPRCFRCFKKEKKVNVKIYNPLIFHPELMKQWDLEKNGRPQSYLTGGTRHYGWWKCGNGHSWFDYLEFRLDCCTCVECLLKVKN